LQEPPRPPSPEPTIAVYENIANLNPKDNQHHHHHYDYDPSSGQWSTITIRLVGSHPLWGHYLYVQFTWISRTRKKKKGHVFVLNLIFSLSTFFVVLIL
jgi:hypothetical protein